MEFLSLFATPHSPIRQSDRIPGEDIARAVKLVERILERRYGLLGNALRRPAFAAMHRAQRAVLAEQENLVHAHAEDLPGHVLGEIAEQKGAHRRDLLRAHLLDL